MINRITLREYAAIKLRVPDSGIDWLDEMILLAKRDELAAQAMQGISANHCFTDLPSGKVSEWAFEQADAMIAAREKGAQE